MFGDKLKLLRQKNNILAKDLARYLNMSKSSYSKYENNISSPNLEIIRDIGKYFSVSLDWLVNDVSIPDSLKDPCIQKYMKLNERSKLKAEVYVDLLLNEQDNQSGDREMAELKKSQALKNTS